MSLLVARAVETSCQTYPSTPTSPPGVTNTFAPTYLSHPSITATYLASTNLFRYWVPGVSDFRRSLPIHLFRRQNTSTYLQMVCRVRPAAVVAPMPWIACLFSVQIQTAVPTKGRALRARFECQHRSPRRTRKRHAHISSFPLFFLQNGLLLMPSAAPPHLLV